MLFMHLANKYMAIKSIQKMHSDGLEFLFSDIVWRVRCWANLNSLVTSRADEKIFSSSKLKLFSLFLKNIFDSVAFFFCGLSLNYFDFFFSRFLGQSFILICLKSILIEKYFQIFFSGFFDQTLFLIFCKSFLIEFLVFLNFFISIVIDENFSNFFNLF